MSTYSLTQRGAIAVTSADGAGPKDVDFATPVKTGSAFIVARIRDRRRDVFVQQGSIAITDADVGGTKDSAAFTSVDTAAAYVILAGFREKRTDGYSGVSIKLQSDTTVRATFNPPAAGDTIDLEFQVVEHKARRGATLRLLDANTLRLEWDGALAAGETIDCTYEVWDIENLGDDIKELLFRLQKILGIQGENTIQDLQTYDNAGNPTSFRVRVFDTKDDAEAATVDLPEGDGLEDGELSRFKTTLEWVKGRNRPVSILSVRTHLLATPDVG